MAARSRALLVVISGPSGAGKDTVLHALKRRGRPWHFAVTATTRPARPGERDGIDYHFLEEAQFRSLLDQGGLLEHALVYGHWYGVPRAPVEAALAAGTVVIVRTDVQGARTLKATFPEALLIMLVPSSRAELEARLRQRETEGAADMARRLHVAEEEMALQGEFNRVVVNRDEHLLEAIEEIETAIHEARERGTSARKA